MEKKCISKFKLIFICLLISTIFLLLYSRSTSPLSSNYFISDYDSNYFMLFGKCMKYGKICYVDLFDNKGPFFFLLQYLGQIIFEGKIGIFSIQVISLSTTLYIINRIFISLKSITIKDILIFNTIFLFAFSTTIEEGNLTEEYALLLSSISLSIYLIYLKDTKNNNPLFAFAFGIMFCIFVFSKITNSVFMCSVVLSIIILLIINKSYKNLLNNAIAFLVGFSLSTLAVCLYCYSKNSLLEMLNATFISATQYSINLSLTERLSRYFSIYNLPHIFLFSYLIILISRLKDIEYKLLGIISSITTFISTISGECYLHYFSSILILFIFVVYSCVKSNINVYPKNKFVITIFIITILLQGYHSGIQLVGNIFKYGDYYFEEKISDYYSNISSLENDIVEHIINKESIWGYNIDAKFYLETNTEPAITYFQYLESLFNQPKMRIKIIDDLNTKKPINVVIPIDEYEKMPDYLYSMIKKDYYLFYSNDLFCLYVLKNN